MSLPAPHYQVVQATYHAATYPEDVRRVIHLVWNYYFSKVADVHEGACNRAIRMMLHVIRALIFASR